MAPHDKTTTDKEGPEDKVGDVLLAVEGVDVENAYESNEQRRQRNNAKSHDEKTKGDRSPSEKNWSQYGVVETIEVVVESSEGRIDDVGFTRFFGHAHK